MRAPRDIEPTARRPQSAHWTCDTRSTHIKCCPVRPRLWNTTSWSPLLRQPAVEEEQIHRKKQHAAAATTTMFNSFIALLIATVAASGHRSSLPATYGDFTISRLSTVRSTGGRLVERPRDLKITSNVMSLRQAPSASLSSSYVQAMRQEGMNAASRAVRAEVGQTAASSSIPTLTCILIGW